MLYYPTKALGLHSSNVPLYIKATDNNDFYLFSAVGSYFLTYRFSNLGLIGTSDRIEENIMSIVGYKSTIFCGCESKVYAFKRAKHVSRHYEYEGGKNWKILMVLGDEGYLFGVNDENQLVIWEIMTGDVYTSLSFPKQEFDIVKILQPTGYNHKILLVSTNGNMQLIDYLKNEIVYAFKTGCNITTIAQTPNNDTIAIGCQDGRVILHNLPYDKTIMKVSQDLGAVSSIAFRTDIEDELIMLTGTDNGHVTMWNLEKGRNIGQTRDFHHGAVSSLFCVPNKPLIISNGPDNSLKVWNYDRPDGTPVLLRARSGHWLPPTAITVWPNTEINNTKLLSAAGDSCLRVFDVYDARKDYSMGRAYLPHHGRKEEKLTRDQYLLPPATQVVACSARDGVWDSVALCHQGHRQVTTWTFSKRCRGKHYLDIGGVKQISADRCVISACGNFIVIGYSNGHIVKFNMQSGIKRGQFGLDGAHSNRIVGLEIGHSSCLVVVVSAGGTCLKLWDLKTCKQLNQLEMKSEIAFVKKHPDNCMVAVAIRDGSIQLVQLSSFIVFQHIQASFHGPVSDITFYSNQELMVVADSNLVKTFDYVNNKLVDCFKVKRVISHLQMDPNDLFLATTHRDDLGIYLWSVRLHWEEMKLSSLPIDYEPIYYMAEAKMGCYDGDSEDEADNDIDGKNAPSDANIDATESTSPETSEGDKLMQLSGLPASYFSSMLNIENIRIRNENATKGLAYSSFFVAEVTETLDGLKWIDKDDDGVNDEEMDDGAKLKQMTKNEKKRKIAEIKTSDIHSVDEFASMLDKAASDKDYDDCMERLVALSPTTIYHEIQMLDPIYHVTGYRPLQALLRLLHNQFNRSRYVEVCSVWLTCLLDQNMSCLTDRVIEHESGIDGLIEHESHHIADQDRFDTLQLIKQITDLIKIRTRVVQKDLAQIIAMAQFANNNL